MMPIIEDSVLADHLDCQNFDLRNVGQLYPVPTGLVGIDDPALSNPRTPPIGSITDLSVNAVANIAQGKLLFNGSPPPEWVGSGSGQMAAGDLVERVANKGVPGGYVALGSDGRVPSTHVDAGTEAGTVSHIELMMPPEMNVAGSPITDHGVFITNWNDVPNESWFGVHGMEAGAVLKPSFLVGPLPAEIVPSIDAAKFTTGVFPPEVLPVASGLAHGMVPDPGLIGLPTDYLGRDMGWHTFVPEVIGMPTCPQPIISLDSWSDKEVIITIRSKLPDSSLFTLLQKYPNYESPPAFSLVKMKHDLDDDVHIAMTVHDKDIIWAYAAKAGYNNSVFATVCPNAGKSNPWIVITPLSTLPYPDPCP
jgi:hypothetical protein